MQHSFIKFEKQICKAHYSGEYSTIRLKMAFANEKISNTSFYKSEIQEKDKHFVVSGVNFIQCNFSKCTFRRIYFIDCKFKDCHFIASKFINCEFSSSCTFVSCNTNYIHFISTRINPYSFKKCFSIKNHIKYSNIAVKTFQTLIDISQKKSQPEYTATAYYLFQKWKTLLYIQRVRENPRDNTKALIKIPIRLICHIFGFGCSFKIFILTTCIIFMTFAATHWFLWEQFALAGDATTPYCDKNAANVMYITFRNMLAYDIAGMGAKNILSKSITALESLWGYGSLALLVSMLSNRFIK